VEPLPIHFYAALALGENFDAVPAPILQYNKTKSLKSIKINLSVGPVFSYDSRIKTVKKQPEPHFVRLRLHQNDAASAAQHTRNTRNNTVTTFSYTRTVK
jgi:hypothetical protein